ncbi:transposase [Flavobacterium sp. LS2P90]|uniref:Transposase n=1 Tax=Flavobacterium xylosi TaxID=3230415 RepID=A0ABW6HZT6_9FLAO
MEINHNLQKLKTRVRENLESEPENEIYSKRFIEPEPVSGKMRKTKGFERFTLTKVNIEFGLIAIAHNFSGCITKARLHNFRTFFRLYKRRE